MWNRLTVEKRQDLLLNHISLEAQFTVVSVEYRLAPEYVFPAGIDDCNDVADWLLQSGRDKVIYLLLLSFCPLTYSIQFGADLNFIGGEVRPIPSTPITLS
jgi:hypothetical protein